MEEHFSCKEDVAGSIPASGSIDKLPNCQMILAPNTTQGAEMITRQELQDLRKRAWQVMKVTPENGWKHAYRDLAHACNVLDALMARNIAGAAHADYVWSIPGPKRNTQAN